MSLRKERLEILYHNIPHFDVVIAPLASETLIEMSFSRMYMRVWRFFDLNAQGGLFHIYLIEMTCRKSYNTLSKTSKYIGRDCSNRNYDMQ